MTWMCDWGVILWNEITCLSLLGVKGSTEVKLWPASFPALVSCSNYYMRPFQVSSTLHLFCDLSNSRWLHPVKEVVQVTCSFLLHFKADVSMAWAILYFIVENILLNLHWLFSLFCTVNLFLKVRSRGVYFIWNLQRNFLNV